MDNPGFNMPSLFYAIFLLSAISLYSADFSSRFMMGPTRAVVRAPHGMVATSQPLAAQAGIEILKSGGNAVDAAVAVNAMLGLTEPQSCGIGGDLFVIYWDNKTQKLYGLNASGRSPYDISLEKLKKRGLEYIPAKNPLAWSVPGCVDGWDMLLKRFGRLDFDKVLAPAIRYAEEGFPVSGWSAPSPEDSCNATFRRTFMPEGRVLEDGDIFRNTDLSRCYRMIAAKGRDAFYRGDIAQKIVEYSKQQGGFFSMRDFEDHRGEWTNPVSTNYRGYDIWELPPNGQGIAALQMLNLLEDYNLAALGHNSGEYLHLLIEAKKLAFADRARYYSDMDFFRTPVEKLISKEYSAERRALINPARAAQNDLPGEVPEGGNTVYLVVADKDHNMISFIQSISWIYGSGHVPEGLGFCLQNRGEMFCLDPEHPNHLSPHRRPFHTIIPAFVTHQGKPWLAFGVMGGAMQPQGHVQVLCNLIDFGMNLQEAGDAPRFRHEGSSEPTGRKMESGGTVSLEVGISPDAERILVGKGHRLTPPYGTFFGGYQAIMLDPETGMYLGASDPRRAGCAYGY